ncbi:exodeoxyribonuclease V subunit gamma [Orrella sp. JC864]|uniref:exodeoxyribonuclease V subunit gamma n=1 Tax=Orrella sp. JC864 TaxID=3120298 RepID=UPI003009FF05
MKTDLQPGFMAVHGNHAESLRDLLLAWITRHPLAPLEDEWVLVQSNGVAQWLKLSLARDRAQGGAGIAAALRTELPSRFIWRAYRAVLGEDQVPEASPLDKPALLWRLMRVLPGQLADPAFEPLRRFLRQDQDLRKRFQLAERLADLFDQYQVYRADWLSGWAAGRDDIATSRAGVQPLPEDMRWQARLWRALLDDVGPAQAENSRTAVHTRFLQGLRTWGEQRPPALPRRLLVFGISSMPQQSLEVLAALARWMQVLLCVNNPSEHDWSHIVADKDLLRAERKRQRARAGQPPPEALDAGLHGHPLLAAWGKQGRDFISLLNAYDDHQAYAQRFAAIGQRIDIFDPNPGDTLLRQLQDDIRDLRPLAETRQAWPPVDPAVDRSIRFHVAHSAQREVEVLHDQLLAALAEDPTLQARDILVMVPDIAAYAPHVQAVFGLPGRDDPRRIPYTLADQGQRHRDPLVGALERLLALPQSRIAVSDVLDLLEVPALRARFGIGPDDLPLLRRWIAAANVRWGLHAGQRQALGLPQAGMQNTWDFGLQRMLLGYACGAGQAWCGIEPLDEIGGLEAALLGPLVRLLQTLERHWRALSEPASPEQWSERLRALLADSFAAQTEADGYTLQRLESTLAQWRQACQDADLREPLPLSVVREHWLAQLDQPSLSQPFFGGAVTFATLMPMRAIPFRHVALLGMNDGDYPRTRAPMDFDLMGRDYRPGDRSRREDDRYLFLEALLSARERLHISWVGRSIHDDTERAPSVLVAQLRDHLAAGWRLDGPAPQDLLAALTVTHRLQPFHPDYYTQPGDGRGSWPYFTYAREWRAAPASAGPAASGPATAELDDSRFEGPLTLALLGDFLKDPVRGFFQLRLGIRFGEDDPVGEDIEPFSLDALRNWQLQDELIQQQRLAVETGRDRQLALAEGLQRMARRGDLPEGRYAELVQADLAEPMAQMFGDYAQALQAWPQALPEQPLEHLPAGLPDTLRLADWLHGVRANGQGERCRLLLDSGSLVRQKPKVQYRRERLVPYWLAHVAAHLDGPPMQTHVISKAGSVTLAPLPRETARRYWLALLQAWRQGLRAPLPLALKTGLAWLEAGGAGEDPSGPGQPAYEAARRHYEIHEPAFMRYGEGVQNPYLARAFPDFAALWAEGRFAHWCLALLRPMADAVGGAQAAAPRPDAKEPA